jgi:hypothetical protein
MRSSWGVGAGRAESGAGAPGRVTPSSSSTSRRAQRAASRVETSSPCSVVLEEQGRLLEQRVERREGVGVLARDARDLLVGDLVVVGQQHRTTVGGEGRELRVERDRAIAELRQLEVGDDLRLEHRDHVRRSRDALAGPQLLGHARAAEDVARLEDAHAQTGAREVGGRGEAVVPAADDDRVVVRPAAVAVAVAVGRAHDPTSTAPASASTYRSATITSNSWTSNSSLV